MDLMTYALCKGNGGGGSGNNILNVTYTNNTLSHTYTDIVSAMDAGKEVTLTYNDKKYYAQYYNANCVIFAYQENIQMAVSFCKVTSTNSFSQNIYSLVPTANPSDNGKELIVKNNTWTKQSKYFIVTLTPTAQDYSGVMDKTVAEINTAYEAGQQIWFKVLTSASTSVEVPLTYWATNNSYDYHGFAANLVMVDTNMLIVASVGSTSEGTRQTYFTTLYPLTPVS